MSRAMWFAVGTAAGVYLARKAEEQRRRFATPQGLAKETVKSFENIGTYARSLRDEITEHNARRRHEVEANASAIPGHITESDDSARTSPTPNPTAQPRSTPHADR